MNTINKHLVRFTLSIAAVLLSGLSATGDMIYQSSLQTISGMGTQLDLKEVSASDESSFRDDLLRSGYVRDEDNSIVGSVSTFASQSSSVTKSQIRGLGRGSGFANGPAEGTGTSELRVAFHADTDMDFTLSGLLRLAPHGLGLNRSTAFVSLSGPDGEVFDIRLDEENPPDGLGIVDFMGTHRLRGRIPAGDYVLEATALGRGSDGLTRCVDFDFAFNLVVVPEPTSAFLLMVVAGMVLAQLRRNRHG